MRIDASSDRLILIAFALTSAAAAFFAGRYLLSRIRGARLPMTEGTLQKGGAIVGTAYKPGVSAKGFIGYVYKVGEIRHKGSFAIAGDSGQVAHLIESLPGKIVKVRYDPARPEASMLDDPHDAVFGGLLVSQQPEHLMDAPRLRFPDDDEV